MSRLDPGDTPAGIPGDRRSDLPLGFQVRIRDDVTWHRPADRGARLLIGGSPVRAVRLTPTATEMLAGHTLNVTDHATSILARRLLDGNLADPALGPACKPAELTVIVPVRDRPEQLDRCLKALGSTRVVVVDDASRDPAAVGRIAQRHDATVIALTTNRGPAGARNAGLATVTTPYVAFVDSDVTVDAAVLARLAGHFADPAVALAGPMVRGVTRSASPHWFERYDAAASSLTLGHRPCSVQAGAAVGWLPSACLVARTCALRGPDGVDGFADDMRVGEDVDLVWRLVEAGWRVRYDPGFEARHDVRPTMTGWLGRKVVYGTGGAHLAERHGDAVAVARLSPLMAIAAAGVLLRRPWPVTLALAATGSAAWTVRRSLPEMPGRGQIGARLALQGLGWAVRQESALLLRHWWPAALAGSIVNSGCRRAVVSALLVDAIVGASAERPLLDPGVPRLGPLVLAAGRRLDDFAYGSGLWLGAARTMSLRALAVHLVRTRRNRGHAANVVARPRSARKTSPIPASGSYRIGS